MILPILEEGGIALSAPRPPQHLPSTSSDPGAYKIHCAGTPTPSDAHLRKIAREIATCSPKLAAFLISGRLV
ncbi:hypothetical protein BH23VER1_BH23VER1_17800 [soil metagenome]